MHLLQMFVTNLRFSQFGLCMHRQIVFKQGLPQILQYYSGV
jgi:hypothetical protein